MVVNVYDRDEMAIFQNDAVSHRMHHQFHLDFEDELLPRTIYRISCLVGRYIISIEILFATVVAQRKC